VQIIYQQKKIMLDITRYVKMVNTYSDDQS